MKLKLKKEKHRCQLSRRKINALFVTYDKYLGNENINKKNS